MNKLILEQMTKEVVEALRHIENYEQTDQEEYESKLLADVVRLLAHYICGPGPQDVYAIAEAIVAMEDIDDK